METNHHNQEPTMETQTRTIPGTNMTVTVLTPGPYFRVVDADQIHVGTCPVFAEQLGAGGQVLPVEVAAGDGWLCSCIELADKVHGAAGMSIDPPAGGTGAKGTPVAHEAAPTADEVNRLIESLDRKFEASDMTGGLVEFAVNWALAWTGDFEYMVDMNKQAKKGRLSDGQAKGVLNCYRADYFRNKKAAPAKQAQTATPKAQLELVHGAIYTDAEGEFIKVAISKAGNAYGKVWEFGEWVYTPGATKRIDHRITAEEAAAWGHEHDHCIFCSHPLSDEGEGRSVEVGYGPVCAAKNELPWG